MQKSQFSKLVIFTLSVVGTTISCSFLDFYGGGWYSKNMEKHNHINNSNNYKLVRIGIIVFIAIFAVITTLPFYELASADVIGFIIFLYILFLAVLLSAYFYSSLSIKNKVLSPKYGLEIISLLSLLGCSFFLIVWWLVSGWALSDYPIHYSEVEYKMILIPVTLAIISFIPQRILAKKQFGYKK